MTEATATGRSADPGGPATFRWWCRRSGPAGPLGGRMEDRWFTDRRVGTRFPYYTRGNAADVLADPVSPLGWTFLWDGAISPGARDGFIVFGLVDWDEFETPEDPECFGLFGGYFYNPLSIVRLMGARLPGASPEDIDRAYFDPQPRDPALRRRAVARERKARREAGREPGLGDVHRRAARGRRGEGPRRPPAGGSARPVDAQPRCALLARARSLGPTCSRCSRRHLGVARRVGRPRRPRRDHCRPGRSDPDHPAARRHRGRLGQAVVRDVGALPAGSPVGRRHPRARRRARGPAATGLRGGSSDGARAFHAAFVRFCDEFGSRGPNEWDLRARSWEPTPSGAWRHGLMRMTDGRRRRLPDSATTRPSPTASGRQPGARALAGDRGARRVRRGLRSSEVFLPGGSATRPTASS